MTGGSKARRAAVRSPSTATPADGIVDAGHAAGARHRLAVDDVAVAERLGPAPQLVDRRGRHAPERDGVAVAAQVGQGRLLQGREHEAAGAQGPGQRVAGAAVDQVAARPAMTPAWGPPSSLSPENVTRAAPAASVWRAAGSRPARRGPAASHGVAASSRPEPRSTTTGRPRAARAATSTGLGEADDAVVRLVHLEDDGDVVVIFERALVVGQSGAVGRADLDQPGARLRHHLGDAEAAADLDQLAPGHDDVAAGGQRGEHEQHGGGAVVHDEGGLGPARPGQQGGGVAVARAPPAGGQVELEVGVGAGATGRRAGPGPGWCGAARRWR